MIYLKTGLIPLNLAYDDEIAQEANGLYQLTFKFPKSDELSAQLKEETLLLADDLHGEQEFFVFEIKKSLDHVTVYANQVATLLNSYAIGSISVDRVPGQTVMTALAGAVVRACPFTFVSDVAGRHTLNLSHVSVMDALAKGKHSIIGQWGGDLVRDKYSVRLLTNGGAENQSLFMYRKNLSQFEQERSIKDLRTRIHFRKVIKGQGEGAQDQVIAVTVDSPLIGQYSQIYEATMTVEDQDVTDEASLRAYGQAYYGKTLCDLPEESMELAVVGEPDTPVRLYDVVSVLYDDYGIDLRLKISKYRYAPMSKRLKSIGFGKVGQTLGGAIGKVVSNQVEEAKAELVDEFDHKLQKELDNANAAFDAEFDKAKKAIDDGIEEAKAAAEVVKAEIGAEVEAVAREGQAVKQAVDAGLAQAKQEAQVFEENVHSRVAEVETKANQVADQARQSDQKAVQALTKAGTSETLAQTAKDTADRALRQAGDNLRTVQERANQLQADLDTAKRSITSQARDILNQAQAQQDLTSRLQTVETTANGTKTTVTELTKTVNTATGNLASVTQRVASTEIGLTSVRDQYSQLSQTVSGQTGQITAVTRQTADLQRGLDGVTERFEKLSVGARNYAEDYDFSRGMWEYSQGDSSPRNWSVRDGIYTVNGTTNTWRQYQLYSESGGRLGGKKDSTALLELEVGQTYTLSVEAKCISGSPNLWIELRDNGSANYNNIVTHAEIKLMRVTSDWKRYSVTFSVKPNSDFGHRRIILGYSEIGSVAFRKVELVKGLITTDAGPADEDIRQELATYIRTATENTSRLEQSIQTADGKAEGAKTLAQQTAQGLALKAEKTSLDTVTGRLETAESTIAQQAYQISQRLTSSQVESAITAKGYQTKDQVDANITGRGYITNAALAGYVPTTSFDNYKTETAQAIERGLTATRALIPTEFSGNILNDGKQVWRNARGATYTLDDELEADRYYTLTVKFRTGAGGQAVSSNVFGHWIVGSYDQTIDAWVIRGRSSTKIAKGTTFYINAHPATGLGNADWATLTKGPLAMSKYQEPFSSFVTSVDFQKVQETAQLYERVIGRSEGDIQTNVARQVLTSQLYQTEVKSPLADLATRLTQLNDSYAIQVLGSSSRILTEINANASGLRLTGKLIHLDGTVTASDAFFRSVLADKIEAGNIKAGAVTTAKIAAGAVTADHLLVNQAMIDKLVTNSLWADRLFAQSAFMAKLQATKIQAGQIDAGLIDTAMLAANAVTADKLLVNQAFFNKLMANEAYLRQLFAKQAFITQVQSVELSASRIKSGVLQAINGSMSVNLDSGQIHYYTDQAALKRILSGYPTQFIKFDTGTYGGKPAGVTVIGSNRDGSENPNNGSFAGIRIWNGIQPDGSFFDKMDIGADDVQIGHKVSDDGNGTYRGWQFRSYGDGTAVSLFPYGNYGRASITATNYRILNPSNNTYVNLEEVLNKIFDNFNNLNNNGNYQRSFYSSWR